MPDTVIGPVLFVSSPFGTPRHRCQVPREALKKLSVRTDFADAGDARLFAVCDKYSHLVLNRVPYTPQIAKLVARAGEVGAKVLFDVDDLLFEPELLQHLPFVHSYPPDRRARLLEASRRIREGMRACGRGLCATAALAREVHALSPAAVVENCVSDELVELSLKATAARHEDESVTVGFLCGHTAHIENFSIIRRPLKVLLARHQSLRLRVVGSCGGLLQCFGRSSDRIDQVPYVDWRALPEELARMDVCLAPLVADRFNECKSDLRFLEAGLCAVPLVASRVGQFAETIRDGENGLLATGEDEWVAKIEGLVSEPGQRAVLGNAARLHVLTQRRTDAMGRRLERALAEP